MNEIDFDVVSLFPNQIRMCERRKHTTLAPSFSFTFYVSFGTLSRKIVQWSVVALLNCANKVFALIHLSNKTTTPASLPSSKTRWLRFKWNERVWEKKGFREIFSWLVLSYVPRILDIHLVLFTAWNAITDIRVIVIRRWSRPHKKRLSRYAKEKKKVRI